MKANLLLLSLFGGLCCGLQPGLEYHYRFFCSNAAGILAVSFEGSGTGMFADVIVQVAEDSTVYIQFTNTEVGDYHREIRCGNRGALDIWPYNRLEHGVELFEKPFKVTVDGNQIMEYMEVPTEPAWITNIKKSVVNIIREAFFWTKRPHPLAHPNFGTYEETYEGRCYKWFTVTKLPQIEAAIYDRDHYLEDDVQRGDTSFGRYASSVPAIDDTVWLLSKHTDFLDCESIVQFKSHVNQQTEDLFTRVNIGVYDLRGNMDGMRMERAEYEGVNTLFSQPDHKDRYESYSNLSLGLVAVRPIGELMTIDYEAHRVPWRVEIDYAVADLYSEDFQPSLEQILTGVEFTQEMHTEVKRLATTLLQELSDWLPRKSTNRKNFATEMSRLVEAISLLHYQDLDEIHQLVHQEMVAQGIPRESIAGVHERKLLILKQAMIESGTDPAIKFFLEKIPQKDFRHMDDESVYHFFTVLPTSIKSPLQILKLMEVVMQLPWDEDDNGLKSVGLIAFSKLANEICFTSKRRSTYWEVTRGKERVCDNQAIIDNYLSYLQQGIENEESPSWQRYIYLQALTYLGIPHVIQILKPYVLGTKEGYLHCRKDAIMSLTKNNMPSTAQGQIFDLLMPVFENIAEHHEVRTSAFTAMTTWELSLSWWQRMALATWDDPSINVANFISATIKTCAGMRNARKLQAMASEVQHLIKPDSLTFFGHSSNRFVMDEYYPYTRGSRRFTFAWLSSSRFTFPSEVQFSFKQMTFLGFTHDFSVNLQEYGSHTLLESITNMFSAGNGKKPPQPDQDDIDIVTGMFHEMKENLGFEQSTKENEEMFSWIAHHWLAYVEMFQKKGPNTTSSDGVRIYVSRILGRPNYHQYVDAYYAFPIDMSLPYTMKHTVKRSWWIQVPTARERNPMDTHLRITIDASVVYHVQTKSLIPWSDKFALGGGSDNLNSIYIPLKIKMATSSTKMQMTLEPESPSDKVYVMDAHNRPFTIQHGKFPTVVHDEDVNLNYVKKYDYCRYRHKYQVFPLAYGLWIESKWEADIPWPFVYAKFLKGQIDAFTPTLSYWEYHILFDPEASTTKSLKTTYTYVSTDKSSGVVGQESQSSADDSQRLTMQRITKSQDDMTPTQGGHALSFHFDFEFQGTPSKKESHLITIVRGITSSKVNTNLQYAWIEDDPTGVVEPAATCLNVLIEKPRFVHFTSVEELMKMDFHTTVNFFIISGVSCQVAPPALEGLFDAYVTPVAKDIALRKMTEDCHGDPGYHPIDMITADVYNRQVLKVHWTEDFTQDMMNFTLWWYDLVRGFRFPDLYYDYTVIYPENMFETRYTRCIETQEWIIRTRKPHEYNLKTHYRASYWVEIIHSPTKMTDSLIYDLFKGEAYESCIISKEKIRTFDGVEIPFQPDSCWSVITMETFEKGPRDNEAESVNIELRLHDGQWEVRIMMPKDGVLLEMTRDSLRVNGEDYREGDPRFDFYYVSDGAFLSMPYFTGSSLKISDNIYFLQDHAFKNRVLGLCGDFNGEQSYEMLGPKGCVYTDPELYVNSWKTPAEGCSGRGYLGLKRAVESYQEACPLRTHVPTGVTYPEMLTNDCSTWHYEERTEGFRKCWALTPTPKCQPHCHPVNIVFAPLMYDCVLTEEARTSEPKRILHRYMTSHPSNCVPH